MELDTREKAVLDFLTSINQPQAAQALKETADPKERAAFVAQVERLNQTYPGGIKEYCERARRLLKDSKEDVNPYLCFTPSVPNGYNLDVSTPEYLEIEKSGMADIGDTAFILVAGGLGERLGYDGIKIDITMDLFSGKTFIQYYIEHILAYQKLSGKRLSLAIMTSDDTHEKTVAVLKKNSYFGLEESQIDMVKQDKVPALLDIDANLSIKTGPLQVDTKPHGHGDVHMVLFLSGVAEKWAKEGKKWVFFFQDTNPLAFRALPATIGVSKKLNLEFNTVTIPRIPGESVGAICRMTPNDPSAGCPLTINVEYNQLSQVLKGGDPVDPKTGCSIYPGNTNALVLSVPEYVNTLRETKGLIAEFINPKYSDATKTKFNSPTRIECMMQDYPKLLKDASRVGFTSLDRMISFTTCKNDLKTAATRSGNKLTPDCASSCENDLYLSNQMFLRLAGVSIRNHPEETGKKSYCGVSLNVGPRVLIAPSFATSLGELKERLAGSKVDISPDSSVILANPEAKFGAVEIDGSYDFVQVKKHEGPLKNGVRLQVKDEDPANVNLDPSLRIRGYSLVGAPEKI